MSHDAIPSNIIVLVVCKCKGKCQGAAKYCICKQSSQQCMYALKFVSVLNYAKIPLLMRFVALIPIQRMINTIDILCMSLYVLLA
jgi:hypothetical protein